jgi:hypothetical protein
MVGFALALPTLFVTIFDLGITMIGETWGKLSVLNILLINLIYQSLHNQQLA